jgi:hypothetical protein
MDEAAPQRNRQKELFIFGHDFEKGGAADRAFPFHRRATVLHGHALAFLHFSLLFAFYAICYFSHGSLLPT